MPAWSYSALTAYETCPRQFYLVRVAKKVKEQESDALRWGNFVHKAFENRLKEQAALPTSLGSYDKLCQKFEQAGTLFVEREAAITQQFKPSGWWDKTTWCRSKWDVSVKHGAGSSLSIWDWKTGSRKPDSDQMKLFAAVGFLHEPKVKVIHTGFVWLKENKLDVETYHRDEAKTIWAHFLPRVKRYEQAHDADHWPAKPSGLCRKHCPVGKANCEFCGS